MTYNYSLGLCCISLKCKEQGIKFQTMTYTQFAKLPRKQAESILASRIINNFKTVAKIVRMCKNMGIERYRLSSDLVPVINHPNVNMQITDFDDAQKIFDAMDEAKQAIIDNNMRTSAHPSEFISLTSEDERVIANSIRDLEQHGEIFDLLGLPQSYASPLNIHIRQQGDVEKLGQTFRRNLAKCSDSVRKRLVVEVNDNKQGQWTIQELYNQLYKTEQIPVTYDNLHHEMIGDAMSHQEAFDMAHSTWPCRPVFHYSEGIDGTRKHADYAELLPTDFGKSVDYEVELKMKDLAIEKMLLKMRAAA
jgi:UV DNA damage endonuclease